MEWQDILIKARQIKEEFDRSYKCLNIDRPIRKDTTQQHFDNLLTTLEKIRVLFNVHYNRLTTAHQAAANAFFLDLKNRILKLAVKRCMNVELPNSLHESEPYRIIEQIDTNMTQTIVEFLNTASKLIIDFDGKSENLQSFIDSLSLVDAIKGSHEATAVSLIKTKLKGNARNLISNETTITEIIRKLRYSVKGESVEVLTAKMMNIRQGGKTANAYCSEIENLTKSLENAYISDGLSSDLANKYSTQVAVKAITKNCSNDKVKLIMEAGQFNNMNEAIGKFVNSCTEATGQQNAILYYGRNFNRQNYRTHYRGKYNRPRTNYNNTNRNQQRPQNNNNISRRRQNNNRGNRNYLRATESHIDSENC